MNYFSYLKEEVNKISIKLRQSRFIKHNLSKGIIREKIIKNAIKPYLPGCYGFSSGEVFDENNTSNQMDLIIYDKFYSYIIPTDDKDFTLFPIESILGVIEVKTKLDKNELDIGLHNIESVKKLHNSKGDKIFGILFFYESIDLKLLLEYLKESNVKNCYAPNLIYLFDKNVIIMTGEFIDEKSDRRTITLSNEFELYGSMFLEANAFPFLINYIQIAITTIKKTNINETKILWDQLKKEILSKETPEMIGPYIRYKKI